MNVLRRVRGVLGTAMLWSIASAPVGVAWSFTVWIGASKPVRGEWAPFPPVIGPMIMCASWGFVGGALFAVALSLLGRRQSTVESLRPGRFALLGGVVGAVLPLVFLGPSLWLVGLCGAIGATVAGMALWTARRNSLRIAASAVPSPMEDV